MMIICKRIVYILFLLLPLSVQAVEYSEGQDYSRLPDSIRSSQAVAHLIAKNSGKVQLLFFFSYGCPACAAFDPYFEKWAKSPQAVKVSIYRFPASFEADWVMLARLYYVTQDITPKKDLNADIFNAIHEQHQSLWKEEVMKTFFIKHGYQAQAFDMAYNSYAVKEQATYADDISKAYDITQTPTIVINGPGGSYKLTVDQAGNSWDKLISIVNYVVAKELNK